MCISTSVVQNYDVQIENDFYFDQIHNYRIRIQKTWCTGKVHALYIKHDSRSEKDQIKKSKCSESFRIKAC